MVSCTGISRFVLVLLNFLLFIIGALLIAVGVLTLYSPGTIISSGVLDQSADIKTVFDTTYITAAAWACTGLGIATVLITLCGCLGSGFMSKVLLGIYIFVVIEIILIQVGIGVLVIFSPEWFTSSANDSLNIYLDQYPGATSPFKDNEQSSKETYAWNFIQYSVSCCGLNGVDDYAGLVNGGEAYYISCCTVKDPSASAILSLDADPGSQVYNISDVDICKAYIKNPVENTDSSAVNDIGCIDKITGKLQTYGIAAIAVVCIQIFIVIVAFIVCCSAKRAEKPV